MDHRTLTTTSRGWACFLGRMNESKFHILVQTCKEKECFRVVMPTKVMMVSLRSVKVNTRTTPKGKLI